jgi:catechol 2,3-dioxygenase-like lactoylglutathione lyase family enzyme
MLQHVAVTSSSEKNADRFYINLLGLEKSGPKILPPSLSMAIFKVNSELLMINYLGESVHFEVFITGRVADRKRQIEHVCLKVDDLQSFVKKCDEQGIEISRIPKGDRILTFIRDYDGNLFEIKS